MAVGIEHSYVFFQAVALLTECVDRNYSLPAYVRAKFGHVALLTECVDRNKAKVLPVLPNEVALLTECVDRNVESRGIIKELGRRTPYGVRG